jgi:Tol biopolymer transport system component
VKVYSSATGRPVSVVTAPTPLTIESVARLGDDHTFVIAALDKKACATHFLKFNISDAGKASAITPLSVPQISGDVEQIAASANGKVLGFALSGCAPQGLQMVVIHLDTGKVTRWSNPGVGGSPSLNADGSVYGFVSTRTERSEKVIGWTIPTDAPAGPLYQHARKVLDLPNNVDSMILSPSGAQLYVETQDGSSQGPMVLDLYRTSTGTLIKQVVKLIPVGRPLVIAGLSMDAASQHLLAYDLGDGSQVKAFDLRTGRHLSLTVPRLVFDGVISTLAW